MSGENDKARGLAQNWLNGTYIDIYGDDYSTEVHAGKYFMHLYNELAHAYAVNMDIDFSAFIEGLIDTYKLTDDDFILKFEQASDDDINKKEVGSSQYFIKLKDKILLEAHNQRLVFWYSGAMDFTVLQPYLDLIQKHRVVKEHTRKFYMIATSSHSEHGFELKEFKVKKVKVELKDHYNDDFAEINKLVNSFLGKKEAHGLVLLHGKFGTGKTTYIRSLISKINKRFIYLPLHLMEAISSPNFLPFMSQYKDSILILEDCEELLAPRDSGRTSSSLVNLLNLGDGLLSDALAIKIVCTFNADIKRIDPAIMRKGRLVARYEFTELEVDKATAIAKKIGADIEIKKATTLADIYNSGSKDFSEIMHKGRVGF